MLFGYVAFGDQVATTLGRFNQYLQPPDSGMIVCLYDNPQSLELPDLSPSNERLEEPIPATLMIEEPEEMAAHARKSRDGEAAQLVDLLAGIEDWFDKLPAHRSIAMATRDPRILTTLFQYVNQRFASGCRSTLLTARQSSTGSIGFHGPSRGRIVKRRVWAVGVEG